MKQLKRIKNIVGTEKDKNKNIYVIENGLQVRDIEIDAKIGEEITVGIISDLHFNYCNQRDFDEADPVIMSTYENRKWLANGESIPIARKCLKFLECTDQIILNGDTLDYLSWGTLEKIQEEIWDKYPDALATVAGHELARKVQGNVEDTMPKEEKEKILQKFWKHDINYTSKLIKDKLLVVVMRNDRGEYSAYQEECLTKDLKNAREKGYAVLLFQHEPIRTNNPNEQCITAKDALTYGDGSGLNFDFFSGVTKKGVKLAGNDELDEQSKAVYKLIIHNADVIKAVFAGHWHSDFNLEILGKNPDGTEAVIPMYIHTSAIFDDGHVMRIIVK